jgi:putative ABC transport system permease protein
VLEAFGIAALLLAVTGLYGVLAGSVGERRRELGVRSALGATPRANLVLVLRYGLALSAVGMTLGVVGAAGVSSALASLLFGITRFDAVTYLGVVVVLLASAAVACAVPAWRAAGVDPMITLKAD